MPKYNGNIMNYYFFLLSVSDHLTKTIITNT
jgi:hypothetical protein